VRRYLDAFAASFGLRSVVRFQSRVERAVPLWDGGSAWPRWQLTSRRCGVAVSGDEAVAAQEEVFDALVVCNGHFSEPRLPDIPGEPTSQKKNYPYRSTDEGGKRISI
jgi:cation diffusion facilitator CzcD-associated flavoprotein CzcO